MTNSGLPVDASDVTTEPTAASAFAQRWSERLPGLVLVVGLAVVATAIAKTSSSLSPLVTGIIIGALVANVVPIPVRFNAGIAFCARSVLRVGIVILGLRLSLGDLGALGASGLVVVAAAVTTTFFGTQWMGRRLGLGKDLSLLVATGYSICGASAIAAMDGVVDAEEEETAYAITLVTLCGSLSIIVLPLIASAVGLEGEQYGTWVGGAVHDVGQVVATANYGGDDSLAAATVVKLTRVVLLAPLVALVALRRRAAADAAGVDDAATETARPPLVPMFVIGFLVAIGVRSSGVLSDGALSFASDLEKIVLTVALVGLGLGVRVAKMRRLGGRPLVLGLLSWVLVAGVAYIGTVLVA